jgi:hypothetical protein
MAYGKTPFFRRRSIFSLGPYVNGSLNLCLPPSSKLLARLSWEDARNAFGSEHVLQIVRITDIIRTQNNADLQAADLVADE